MAALVALSAMLAAAPAAAAGDAGEHPGAVEIRVVKLPAEALLVRQFTGRFLRHVDVVPQVARDAEKLGLKAPGVIGIYPMDPDAVRDQDDRLLWYLAVAGRPESAAALAKSATPPGVLESLVRPNFGTLESGALTLPRAFAEEEDFTVAELPSSLGLVRDTSFPRIATDGLAMKVFLHQNSFVQTGATRNVLLAGSPELPQGVRIIFPVKKRPEALAVDQLDVQVEGFEGVGAARPAASAGTLIAARLEKTPERTLAIRQVRGSYERHADLCAEASKALAEAGVAEKAGPCMRRDLVDPHAPDRAENHLWQVAFEVPGGTELASPFTVETLPAGLAITRETTHDRKLLEELAIAVWIVENGFVHSAPVHTRFVGEIGGDPAHERVRLEIPVMQRFREIPVELVTPKQVGR